MEIGESTLMAVLSIFWISFVMVEDSHIEWKTSIPGRHLPHTVNIEYDQQFVLCWHSRWAVSLSIHYQKSLDRSGIVLLKWRSRNKRQHIVVREPIEYPNKVIACIFGFVGLLLHIYEGYVIVHLSLVAPCCILCWQLTYISRKWSHARQGIYEEENTIVPMNCAFLALACQIIHPTRNVSRIDWMRPRLTYKGAVCRKCCRPTRKSRV